MDKLYNNYFFIAWSILFPSMIVFVLVILNKTAGLKRHIDVDMGQFICSSETGSGSINGVWANRCLKVYVYENGWLFKLSWLFGGGKLWLSRNNTKVDKMTDKLSFFRPERRTLTSGNDCVVLVKELAHFVTDTGTEFIKLDKKTK